MLILTLECIYFRCYLYSDAAAGATPDWSRDIGGVKYPYTVELRGRGFVTDEEDIQLSFEEIWNGLVAMTDEITAVHNLSRN